MARKIQLLLVDDDEADILICQEALKKAPFVHGIAVCRSGKQALDYLQRKSPYHKAPRPDLVLLDINMPGMDGLEVLRRIKSDPDLQRIPVCMLTTSDAKQDVAQAYAAHANAYVPKPGELDMFIAAVRRVVEFWTQDNELPGPGQSVRPTPPTPIQPGPPATRFSKIQAQR